MAVSGESAQAAAWQVTDVPLTARLGRDRENLHAAHDGHRRHLPGEPVGNARRRCGCPGSMDNAGCALDADGEDLLCGPCRAFCFCLDDDGNRVGLFVAELRGLLGAEE